MAAHLLYVGVHAAGALLRGAWMTIVFLEHTVTYTVSMGPKIVSHAPARRTSEPVCVLFCVQALKKEKDALQNCYLCVISFK